MRPTGLKRWNACFQYLSDIVTFLLGVFLAHWWLYTDVAVFPYARLFIFLLLITIVFFMHNGLYEEKRSLFSETDFRRMVKSYLSTVLLSAALLITFAMVHPFLVVLLCASLLFALVGNVIGRVFLSVVTSFFRKRGFDQKRVVFFGENLDLAEKLKNDVTLGYQVKKTITSVADLKKALTKKQVDIVFLSRSDITDKLMDVIIKFGDVHWKIIPGALNLVFSGVDFDEFRDYPIINVFPRGNTFYARYGKRIFDVVVSGFSLVVLSPFFFIIALLIKMTMPGPIFFRQERLGTNLTPFRIFKFRSMIVDAEQKKATMKNEVKGLFKMKNDPRVTPLGRCLRRTGIDELPQLINIFLGDMSLVGPRPHLESELHHYTAWRRERFAVKPGLTGLWQVNGRHELNFDKAVLYDIYYARNTSLWLDMVIILRTIPSMLLTRGRY